MLTRSLLGSNFRASRPRSSGAAAGPSTPSRQRSVAANTPSRRPSFSGSGSGMFIRGGVGLPTGLDYDSAEGLLALMISVILR